MIELLIVVAIIGIVAAIALPQLWAAKRSANEASAIGSLRTLNTAESVYASSCANGRFATSWTQLVNGQFASPDMLVTPKSGFNFAMTMGIGTAGAPDCVGGATATSYYGTAWPISPLHGSRSFATNPGGTIWQNVGGAPPAEPFTATPTIVPIGEM